TSCSRTRAPGSRSKSSGTLTPSHQRKPGRAAEPPPQQAAMRIRLLAVGTRMPGWVKAGYEAYAKRMPKGCQIELVEITPGKRQRGTERAMADESQALLGRIGRDDAVIALDVKGKPWSTEQLAGHMDDWLADGRDRALLIGGPDGLAPEALARAEQHWSLSA